MISGEACRKYVGLGLCFANVHALVMLNANLQAEGEHWQSETITPDFTPASLLALLPSELLRCAQLLMMSMV